MEINLALCLLVGSVGIGLFVLESSRRILAFFMYSCLSMSTNATCLSAVNIMQSLSDFSCLRAFNSSLLRLMGLPRYPVEVSPNFFYFCSLQALSCKLNGCYMNPIGEVLGGHSKLLSMGQKHFLWGYQGDARQVYDPFSWCEILGLVWAAIVAIIPFVLP